MEFTVTKTGLILKADQDVEKMLLEQMEVDGVLETDDAMYELFEDILANSEYEWITPQEIGALTDAPILGIREENGDISEAYGFMDYCVRSLLGDLKEYGEAKLISGD